MLVLFIGDSHGNLAFMRHALRLAKEVGAGLAVQVGDFGFWPSKSFSFIVDNDFREAGVPLWVIRGNHDFTGDAVQYCKPPALEPGLTWVQDGFKTEFDGVTIGFMGGAVSVDQDARVIGRSWWPDEITHDDHVLEAIGNGDVDVWVTHDSVFRPPMKEKWNFKGYITDQLDVQQQKMEKMFRILQPRLHIHGHWHCRYSAPTDYGQVIGLDFENSNALLLVDFTDGKVVAG